VKYHNNTLDEGEPMQISFGMYEDKNRRQKKTMLEEMDKVLDFPKIEKLLTEMYRGTMGRPPIPPLILFKALLLESWYDLSDVEVVQEIHDRRSFERFVGEGVRDYHVDDTTLVKFRERLRETGLLERVWAVVQQGLDHKGLLVKKGAIVDSTLVEGACKPESKRQDGKPVDEDVHYTSRNGQAVDGMKVHVGQDEKSGLIRKMSLSHIGEHDHEHFEKLLPKGVKRAYADKAYKSAEHDEYLRKRGIQNRVLHRAWRGQGLTQREVKQNKVWGHVRSRVEATMSTLKRWCSMGRMRYYGIARNKLWILVCGIAFNGKRAVKLASV
jgi:transposase, IS5 family